MADRDPLPPHLRGVLLARHPLFVASHWVPAGAAVVGVVVALATLRPPAGVVPRRLLLVVAWTLGIFTVVRAVGPTGFGLVGDVLLLTGVRTPPVGHAALARTPAWWDLLLWSPFFLLWGLCRATAGWQLGRLARTA